MKLERPTHVRKSNRSSGWLSEFTEEIPGQIAAGINRLGDGEYTIYSIYPLPPDAAYDETIYPDEWVQTTGIAPDRLTVEIRRLDSDGFYRVYTIGHPTTETDSEATEPIRNGDNSYLVRPAEVLSATEAIDLFQHFYDHHGVPSGWELREQPEFTMAADASATAATKPGAGISRDTPASSPATTTSRTAPKKEPAHDKLESRRQTRSS
ncbi:MULTISPECIES: hypothetical protein [Mycobacterium]|uniref:Uncharacterized protein n=1 Tax=Mycobacterium kiyosense TaxID=2871094 RepID=A0A9P3Q4F9_9MYCO|nr:MULTISPECIES: hypothetical protein [Mycobacterium]BDB43334.1 hypothetical protein IWGMT90018_37800 [Mycobacterium kiyosense]BDE13499.1 hypothetical protein MKCMC460_23590 [Mycobacterium sp. 20KCMC460]GLB84163.1 hypothetical protein SRL2020028_34190 [Mycobacterium kiyosense]GLB88431.1 hypothetical protein SRL2020130_12480 [Mycobacterium kiyosense]GLB94643.1 hypothetical protein SRL2020226_14190 [Mycobacterium kiyosense]